MRSRDSVYLSISQYDNHRSKGEEYARVYRATSPADVTPLTGSRLRLRPMTGSSRLSRAPLQCSGVPDRPLAGDDGGDCRDDGSSRRETSRPRAGNDQINNLRGMGRSKAPGSKCAGFGERGRRRTRQDQTSRGAWRPGEIAELGRSAPNEENLFLLPDRFSKEPGSPKGRSSRLT